MSSQFKNKVEQIQAKIINLQDRQITAYIHCSKLNNCWLALKQVPLLMDWFLTQSENTKQFTSAKNSSFTSLLSIVDQVEDLLMQCTKETCVQFLLSTSVSSPKAEIAALRDAAVSAFRQLDIQRGVDLFKVTKDELDLQDMVDMKRITQILIQISATGREDVKQSITERFESLKHLGISISRDNSTDVSVPDLPANVRLVMKHDEIEVGKKIGNGQSGVVSIGKIKATGDVVAVKILHRRALSQPEVESFRREIFALSVLNHPTLVCFRGYTEEPPFYIITEYMQNGSLFDVLRSHPKELTPTIRSLIALDIARGIDFLHGRKIIHRDLKSLNILLNDKYRAKICDFGMVRTRTQGPMTGMIGTAHWMAPEVLMSSPYYNEKVDVYSFAILLWELLTGDMPYKKLNPAEITIGVIQGGLRPPMPENTPPKLKELIEKCWHQDPTKRPPISRVLAHLKNPKYHFEGTKEKTFLKEAGISKKKRHKSKIDFKSIDIDDIIAGLKEDEAADRALLLNQLCDILTKRSKMSKFVEENGLEIIINILNKYDDESDMLLRKLVQCKSKKVFDINILNALLNYSQCDKSKLRRHALQALLPACELRFHLILQEDDFISKLLLFLRKNIKIEIADNLLTFAQKYVSSLQAYPDGITETLLLVRRDADPFFLPSLDSCLISCLLYPSARREFTQGDIENMFDNFTASINVLSHFCEGVEPHPCDGDVGRRLKEIEQQQPNENNNEQQNTEQTNTEQKNTEQQNTEKQHEHYLVKCFLTKIACNPRFNLIVARMLPLRGEPNDVAEIYLSLLQFPEIMNRLIVVPQFYTVAAWLISNGQIAEVCTGLRSSPVVIPSLLLQSGLCQALARAFAKSQDTTAMSHLMYAIFATANSAYVAEYHDLLPRLNSLMLGIHDASANLNNNGTNNDTNNNNGGNVPAKYDPQYAALKQPAFLCIAAIAFHGSKGVAFNDLLVAATQFACNSEQKTSRDVATKLIREYAKEKDVNLPDVLRAFVDNYQKKDPALKIAVATLFTLAKARKDVDSALRQKIQRIYGALKAK